MSTDSKSFEADYAWVDENRDKLVEQYANRWIGVQNGQVVASDSNLDDLLSKLQDPAHQDPAHTVVEFITCVRVEVAL